MMQNDPVIIVLLKSLRLGVINLGFLSYGYFTGLVLRVSELSYCFFQVSYCSLLIGDRLDE